MTHAAANWLKFAIFRRLLCFSDELGFGPSISRSILMVRRSLSIFHDVEAGVEGSEFPSRTISQGDRRIEVPVNQGQLPILD